MTDTLTKNKFAPTLIFLCLPLVFESVLLVLYPALAKSIIITYTLFQFFLILVPSLAAGTLFFRNQESTILSKIFLGYPVAMVSIVFLDLISAYVDIRITEAILVLCSFYILYEERSTILKGCEVLNLNTYLFIALYGIIGIAFFLNYTVHHIPALHNNLFFTHEENYWNIGNTWSYLNWGIPIKDPRALGTTLGPYHCFQNIYHALVYKITGITPDITHLLLEPYFVIFFLVGMMHYVSSYFKLHPIATFLITISVFFLSDQVSYYNLNYHIFRTPVSFFISIPVFALFFYCIYKLSKGEELSVLYLVFLFLYLGANKIILIPICFAAIFILLLYKWMVNKKLDKRLGMVLIFFILCGIFLKLTIYKSESTLSETYKSFFEKPDTSKAISVSSQLKQYLTIFKNNVIEILFHWSFILTLALFILLKDFRQYVKSNLAFYMVLLLSVFFIIILSIVVPLGVSNIYYRFYKLILFYVTGAFALQFILANLQGAYKKVSIIAFVLLLISPFYNGINTLQLKRTNDFASIFCINKDEMEAAEWLRAHTEKYDVLAHDFRNVNFRDVKNLQASCQMFWSGLSGRTMFVDGFTFLTPNPQYKSVIINRLNVLYNIIHSTDIQTQKTLLSKTTISYLIVSKRFGGTLTENVNLERVFANNSLEIYKTAN